MEPFGEIGANFPLHLSSRTQFAKISNKKVIAENQCENVKKLSFLVYNPVNMFKEALLCVSYHTYQ